MTPKSRNSRGRRPFLAFLVACALPLALAPLAAPSASPAGSEEATRSKPLALRLARQLPTEAHRIDRLREPATEVEAQLGVALDELGRMSALAYDQHYLPAVIAVGRAFVAASGRDPLTRTTVNPEYTGLVPELTDGAKRLGRAAGDARALAGEVKRLTRLLGRATRRADRLEHGLERARDSGAR
jgi:hypothetical protein